MQKIILLPILLTYFLQTYTSDDFNNLEEDDLELTAYHIQNTTAADESNASNSISTSPKTPTQQFQHLVNQRYVAATVIIHTRTTSSSSTQTTILQNYRFQPINKNCNSNNSTPQPKYIANNLELDPNSKTPEFNDVYTSSSSSTSNITSVINHAQQTLISSYTIEYLCPGMHGSLDYYKNMHQENRDAFYNNLYTTGNWMP